MSYVTGLLLNDRGAEKLIWDREHQGLQPGTCQGLASGLWTVFSLPLPQRDQAHTTTGHLSPSSEDRKMLTLSRQMEGFVPFLAYHSRLSAV